MKIFHIELGPDWERDRGGWERERYPYFKWIEVSGAVPVLPTCPLCACWVSVWAGTHKFSSSVRSGSLKSMHDGKCMRTQTRPLFILQSEPDLDWGPVLKYAFTLWQHIQYYLSFFLVFEILIVTKDYKECVSFGEEVIHVDPKAAAALFWGRT